MITNPLIFGVTLQYIINTAKQHFGRPCKLAWNELMRCYTPDSAVVSKPLHYIYRSVMKVFFMTQLVLR